MFASVFTDELSLDVGEALPVISSWGLEHCDLRGRVFGKSFEGLTGGELAEVKNLLAENGMKFGAFQSSLAKVHLPDAERQRAEAEKLEGVIRAADALDCRLVRSFNFWQPQSEEKGALAEKPDRMQRVLDMFGPLARRAEEAGLVFAFENCGQTTEEVFALLDALGVPGWGLAWDCRNGWEDETKAGDVDYIVRCVKRARMVHVKAKGAVAELGEPILPWDRILAACAAAGLEGPVSVETHNPKGSGFTPQDMSHMTYKAVSSAWPSAAPGDVHSAASAPARKKVERSYEDDPVRFVMVGLGMGHNRAKDITQTPGTRLVGVCDVREDRCKRSSEALGVPYKTDLAEWLGDDSVEVVYVVTETGRHAELGIRALEAGKHVITTKPMEATLAACDDMIRAADRQKRVLAVDFGRRFDLDVLSLKKAVEDGFLGRLLGGTVSLKVRRTMEYFSAGGGWRGTRRWDGGGVFSNQFIHNIDEIAFCLGIPERVRADIWTQDHEIEAEDLGCAAWAYANGLVVQLFATTCFPQPTWYSRVEIHGTEGACICTRGGPGKSEQRWFHVKLNGGEWRSEAPVKVESDWLNAADNFAAAVREGAPLVASGRDGRRSQAILDAMYRSAYDGGGGWVEVDTNEP